MARTIPIKEIKKLWGLAAGRCAFPRCQVELIVGASNVDPEAVLGFIAHICAYSSVGPRGDPNFPEEKRNLYPNLILLCGHHHTLVDQQSNTYTIKDLTEWKEKHEKWVRQRLANNMPSVQFPELQVITSTMIDKASTFDTNYTLIDPRAKMQKNELTDKVNLFITMGLSKSKEVNDFIQKYSTIDQEFPNKLKSRFVSEYERLRDTEKLRGDDLFFELMTFAAMGSTDFKQQCAGLAVIGYLFERCEVFEK